MEEAPVRPFEVDESRTRRMRHAVVCASNFNRSMEAHKVFANANLNVRNVADTLLHRFAPARKPHAALALVRPTQREPNIFPFGTPYKTIYDDLMRKDQALYRRNGLLTMLERNMQLKHAPERWQANTDPFDIVIAFEERVFDAILEDMQRRGNVTMQPVLVINLVRSQGRSPAEGKRADVRDNAEEASLAAPKALQLCQMLEAAEDWEGELERVLDAFQGSAGKRPLFNVCFY